MLRKIMFKVLPFFFFTKKEVPDMMELLVITYTVRKIVRYSVHLSFATAIFRACRSSGILNLSSSIYN